MSGIIHGNMTRMDQNLYTSHFSYVSTVEQRKSILHTKYYIFIRKLAEESLQVFPIFDISYRPSRQIERESPKCFYLFVVYKSEYQILGTLSVRKWLQTLYLGQNQILIWTTISSIIIGLLAKRSAHNEYTWTVKSLQILCSYCDLMFN